MNSLLVNWNLLVSAVKLVNFERITCSFVGVTCSFDAITFRFVIEWILQHIYSGGNSVEEVGGGGGKALQIFDKFVLILHIFLITMEKYGNDKNDFLHTQPIRQLDKYSISVKNMQNTRPNTRLFWSTQSGPSLER